MKNPTSFEKEYFIQTRQEIDTEKRERDRILNFIVLILGAIGFALIREEVNLLYFSGHRVKHFLYYGRRRCPHDKKTKKRLCQRVKWTPLSRPK